MGLSTSTLTQAHLWGNVQSVRNGHFQGTPEYPWLFASAYFMNVAYEAVEGRNITGNSGGFGGAIRD